MQPITVFTDASSRYVTIISDATTGRKTKRVSSSSIGAVIKQDGVTIGTISQKVDNCNSTYAEFLAMYATCRYLVDNDIRKVDFYADCINLVMMVNQRVISGKEDMRKLSYAILEILQYLDSYSITWIPRRDNKEAHGMAAKAFKIV